MTPAMRHRHISRAIGWRLAAGVLPLVLAVGLVAGLFYYGEIGREAPRAILIGATALTVLSIAIAWMNAAYFADRLSRLARTAERVSGPGTPSDEFDRIERAVGDLGSALTAAEQERVKRETAAAARLRDQATMLAGAVGDSLVQLDQVRLPLQILLESPFGELNDNQEELLRDARAAADSIDAALRRLAQVADIDRDAFQVQHELVQINDVVRSVLPLARAAAERRGARTETLLEPGLPRVMADRARLAEAISLLVAEAAEAAGPDRPLNIATERDGQRAMIRIEPRGIAGDGATPPAPRILAGRLITAQGGELGSDEKALTIRVGR